MWSDALLRWNEHLHTDTGLNYKSVTAYMNDVSVWATWANRQGVTRPEQVTAGDVKEFRDSGKAGSKASTVNRRLTSLRQLLTFLGRNPNPVDKVDRLRDVSQEEDGRALTRNEWNAVRRMAEMASEQASPPGSSLGEALIALFRYAGPRVSEVCSFTGSDDVPFTLGDVTLTPRSGEIRLRHGKGGRSRTVPLVAEAREPLRAYVRGVRERRISLWAERRRWTEEQREWWLSHPSAPLFLGERGPLTSRGARHIISKIGVQARLDFTLGPHDLRATMITALIDPGKYGLMTKQPVPITVVARLVGHANIETTARYARPSQDDLLRFMVGTGD